MNDTQKTNLLEFACETAVAAGALLREKWHQPRELISKGFRDIVTDADFASQKVITDAIQARYPAHGFLTEEEDETLPADGDVIWIIDPVDGTTNYSRQMPNFCISIAAARRTGTALGVEVGVIYDPMRDELFAAGRGQGARLGARPLRVSTTGTLAETILALDWSHEPGRRAATLGILNKVGPQIRTLRAIGSAALAMAWLAAGRVDAYFNLNLYAWDVAAAQLLVREAGGRVTDFDGAAWHWRQRRSVVTNGRLHGRFRQLLQSGKETG